MPTPADNPRATAELRRRVGRATGDVLGVGEPYPGIQVASVLLVDDHPENLLALEALLAPLELRTVRAASGEDALRKVLVEDFAVILLDVQMPGTDGIETARLIKARERSRTTPIIFLTALDRDRRRATLGYESGAVDYLFKPFDPDILRAKVAAFVELHRHREELAWHQQRRYADAAIRESEERYRLVQMATNDVIWDWDLVDNTLRWNEQAYAVFGVQPGELRQHAEWWSEHIHPEDRQRVVEGINAVIDRRDGQAWSAEYRFRIGDGRYRTFLDRGYVARDSEGRPLRMIGAMQDITERSRAQAETDAAREEAERARADAELARRRAEEANQAKSDFLATMSHEIRTPINAVLGYSELLELGISGPLSDEQRIYLGRIRASTTHLLGLVNEVLDLAKVEAGQMTVRRQRASVSDAVDTALALVRPQALERGVALSDESHPPDSARPAVGGGGDGLFYVGDEHRVRQILANLLSNAVKFTAPGGRVTVRGTSADHPDPQAHLAGSGPWTAVEVEDTGIGIAPDQIAAVFEPFVQAERGHTRTHGGTGLGLAISRRLARLMGGDITARSDPGVGSRFTLWLPAMRVAETAAERGARAERRTPTFRVHGLGEVGDLLREEIGTALAAFSARLRADPLTPLAREMGAPQLEDHQVSFLADLAQTLVILEEAGGDTAGLLRDGSAIQRTVAEHHGARRFAQGWADTALQREFEILREEVDRAVRSRVHSDSGDVEAALGVITRLVERAREVSVGAWRHAAQNRER